MFVTLGVEDALSESVAKRLIQRYAQGAQVVETVGFAGNAFLRAYMPNFNQIARYTGPVLVLTDLDRPSSCPPNLLREWSGNLRMDPNLLLRVVVLEIESWIMADRAGLAEWLMVAQSTIPRRPEEIVDPKRALIELCRRSRSRSLREALVRDVGDGNHRTGPDYNDRLGEFATDIWNPEAARLAAPSLDRAINRIADMPAIPSESLP